MYYVKGEPFQKCSTNGVAHACSAFANRNMSIQRCLPTVGKVGNSGIQIAIRGSAKLATAERDLGPAWRKLVYRLTFFTLTDS